jgi:hypothetical protein
MTHKQQKQPLHALNKTKQNVNDASVDTNDEKEETMPEPSSNGMPNTRRTMRLFRETRSLWKTLNGQAARLCSGLIGYGEKKAER